MATTQRGTSATGRTRWKLDPAHTTVEFSAKHMMITTVKGSFSDVSGTIEADEAHPDSSSAEASIDAASIDTRSEQRDAHLRSADFLDVENNPVISFRSKQVRGAAGKAGDSFQVTGDLTIRGVTREVTLDTTYEGKIRDMEGKERAGFSATTTIDRRDFGLVWNQALETGGLLVGNEITITIEAEAVEA
ncbi:MAG TPA: YceI family protein [Gemmatimonadaceae bacterium]|nr:YceI family protein [Gemmatimonadaceae bacterium]